MWVSLTRSKGTVPGSVAECTSPTRSPPRHTLAGRQFGGDGRTTQPVQGRLDALERLPAAKLHHYSGIYTLFDEKGVRSEPAEVVTGAVE